MQQFIAKQTTLLLVIALVTSGCSTLADIAGQVQKPSLSIADVHITGFSFQEIELTYDIEVTNPNPVALNLVSYGYNLAINGNTFVQGNREKGIAIEPSDKSIVQVPVRLNFNELYQLFGNLANKDQAAYKLAADLSFNLPVVGKTTLPITKEGTLPLLKMPKIEMAGIKVKNMGLAQTDLVLNLQMNNPNGFGLLVNALSYSLDINGTQWVTGTNKNNVKIGKNGNRTIQIPISLNTMKVGTSAIQLLQGNEELNFQFDGSMNIGTTHPLLDQTRLIFDKAGKVPILN